MFWRITQNCPGLKMKTLWYFKMSGITNLMMQCHISEEMNFVVHLLITSVHYRIVSNLYSFGQFSQSFPTLSSGRRHSDVGTYVLEWWWLTERACRLIVAKHLFFYNTAFVRKSCGKDPAGPQPEMEVQCLNHGLLVPHFLNVRNSRLELVWNYTSF